MSQEVVHDLWVTGMLRADLLHCSQRPTASPFPVVREDEEAGCLAADERMFPLDPPPPPGGSSGLSSIEPHFHPFRYAILAELGRLCRQETYVWPGFGSVDGLMKGLTWWTEQLGRHFTTGEANQKFNQLNDWIGLAVASEPCVYPRIVGVERRDFGMEQPEYLALVADQWQDVSQCYASLDPQEIHEARESLAWLASWLDENRGLHTLLRLGNKRLRDSIRGRLAGAVHLLTIAEVLRRAAERVWSTQLLEENELGFGRGRLSEAIKSDIYGGKRLFDFADDARRNVLRQYGLDYGVRLRWYVEGDTEHSFLAELLGELGVRFIQLINLRGRFADRGVLAFTESLRLDRDASVFSLISLDADRSDYLQAVRRAAEQDEICGMFFVASPDFEFHNFTATELAEVLWRIVGATCGSGVRPTLDDAIRGTKSAEEFFTAARKALGGMAVGKGAQWGRALADYHRAHPKRPDGLERPIAEAMGRALWARGYNYHSSRNRNRVDPATGRPAPRSRANPAPTSPDHT